MIVGGIPFDQCAYPGRPMSPIGGVLHRTYGAWPGDYSVGKRNPSKVGFHFLIGRSPGQWVQFNDTGRHCNHAPGANRTHIGIEFTGTNEDPLTDWQIRAGAHVMTALTTAYGWALDYYDGFRRRPAPGWTTHASVLGSDHGDRITRTDWNRLVAAMRVTPPTPAPPPPSPISPPVTIAGHHQEGPVFLVIDTVGIFAVLPGPVVVPLDLPTYAAMKDRSPGTPLLTLPPEQGQAALGQLLKASAKAQGA